MAWTITNIINAMTIESGGGTVRPARLEANAVDNYRSDYMPLAGALRSEARTRLGGMGGVLCARVVRGLYGGCTVRFGRVVRGLCGPI